MFFPPLSELQYIYYLIKGRCSTNTRCFQVNLNPHSNTSTFTRAPYERARKEASPRGAVPAVARAAAGGPGQLICLRGVRRGAEGFSFLPSPPRFHMLLLLSDPVPLKLVRDARHLSRRLHPNPPPPGHASPPHARTRSSPQGPARPRPSPKARTLVSPLAASRPTSLTCGARALPVPDPLGFRRLLLGTLRHRGGSYGYSGGAGRYFRFR